MQEHGAGHPVTDAQRRISHGIWNSQGGVADTGDYPLHLNASYAIELNNGIHIDEWKKGSSNNARRRCPFW
jgi:hypothetical protein